MSGHNSLVGSQTISNEMIAASDDGNDDGAYAIRQRSVDAHGTFPA
jgi:hypothetical protein